ncbi:MAG: chemotaxis protein methyltransferase CheR, partial [Rhodospirillaceae bacterium]|nr:chemotaxis protein methyltransferase CheR [Rhodospirillaceae bacterium]
LRAHPTSIELRHLHVLVLMALGRYEKARTAVQRLIYLDPTLAVAHFLNGSVLRNCGMADAARRGFERTCALCSSRPAGEPVPLFEGQTAAQLTELARRQIEQLSQPSDGRSP